MQNFQIMTERDRREAAAIERRRALEEERKKRIFNPRQRLFWIDYETLDKQIEEKRRRDEEESRIQGIFVDQLKKNDEMALAMERKEFQERQKVQQEMNNFRLCCQRPEDRREFDLNDPNRMKKEKPVRMDDNDPLLGPSSAQKFEGEDLISQERERVQRDQMKAWLEQQMQEKQAFEAEQKTAEEAYREAIKARDQRALQLEEMERQCRQQLDDANRRFNKALACEKEIMKKSNYKREQEDNLAEMYNLMSSDMLTENPDVSRSNLGPNRQIGYLYRGMTPEQRDEVRTYQLAQIEETKKKKELEDRMNREFDDYINGTQMTISLMDEDLQKKQKDIAKKLAEENKRLAAEQKSHKLYLEKVVYANNPTRDFYEQFNKSSR